ncbi:MAG: zinc-binding dehydrogenase [Candidatus Bathyarchaeia archaeon]|nr:zinc-binding dehydrogenase [Candidatus Bathyarchaeota archaeon]
MDGEVKKHKAILLKQPYTLVLEEIPTPTPSGEAVLLRVLSAGICHSDVLRWRGELPCPEGRRAGAGTHEVVGEIVARGEEVPEPFKEGLKVLVCSQATYIKEDQYTRVGLTHHTKNEFFGGMQEYILLPHYRCLVSVEGLEDIHAAAPLACAGLTAYGAIKKLRCFIKPGDHVAIIGLGGLGLYAAQWANTLMPYAKLIGVDLKEEALNFASKIAKFSMLINASKEDPIKVINDAVGGEGIRGVVDFVGKPETISKYLNVVGHLGAYIIVGVMGDKITILNLRDIVTKEITIQGSFMGSLQDQYEVVEFARSGLINYRAVVTRRLKFDVEEVSKAFIDLDQGKVIGRQIVEISK